MASFDGPYTSSYQRFIVTMALSCIIFEIKRYISRKSRFFHIPPAFDIPIKGCLSDYCRNIWYEKTRMVWLYKTVIRVKQSLRICFLFLTQYINVTHTHPVSQPDRHRTTACIQAALMHAVARQNTRFAAVLRATKRWMGSSRSWFVWVETSSPSRSVWVETSSRSWSVWVETSSRSWFVWVETSSRSWSVWVEAFLLTQVRSMCSWTLPCASSLVPSVLHLPHGFQCSPTLNRQPYEGRLPLTSWWRKSSNMTVGQCLISSTHQTGAQYSAAE